MFAKTLLPVLAVVGSAAAQCTQATATINAPADATGLSNCQTFKGSIVVNTGANGIIDLTGISQITGDLKVENNGVITTLSSSTLNSIGGTFTLNNVTGLSTLSLTSLSSVGSIAWTSLSNLDLLTFGTPGVTRAKSVVIGDTFLSSLAGVEGITSCAVMNINNNHRLTQFTPALGNLTDTFSVQANGLNFKVSMPNLIWIANMTISNVTTFDVPVLQTVNGSARFDSNYFSTFTASNLTSTKSGDLSFVGNAGLTNITVPSLTSIGGGLLIANNTNLQKVDGFDALTRVGGAIKLRGSFNDIEFPAINDVKGTFDATSTGDISSSCSTLQKHAPSKSGGDGKIQGTFNCKSNDQNSNSDTNGTSSGGSGGGQNSAGGLAINTALLGLAVVGGLVALL